MTARALDRSARTPRGLLARLGRWLLWAAVGVVLLRGLAATLTSAEPPAVPRATSARSAWPDDEARAFAVEFAVAYLGQRPASTPAQSGLTGFASPELADQLPLQPGLRARPMDVRSVIAERAATLDARHALITVAAAVGDGPARTMRLTVPVARDGRGGLVVYDLPSLAAALTRASDAPPVGEPLTDNDAAITDVLTRFLRAYLAGDRAGLSYLVPAGTPTAAVAGGFELLDVRSVATVGPQTGPVRQLLVTVDARDRASRTVMVLRYRVRLVRRDRWYVAGLNTAGSGAQ